jgi:hypothetical protein
MCSEYARGEFSYARFFIGEGIGELGHLLDLIMIRLVTFAEELL